MADETERIVHWGDFEDMVVAVLPPGDLPPAKDLRVWLDRPT